MNSRERVLAAIKCEPVDRIPFVPNLNGFNILSMPKKYHSMKRWDILRELGIDLYIRFRTGVRIRPPLILLPAPDSAIGSQASCLHRYYDKTMPVTDKIQVSSETIDGATYVIAETPAGRIRWGWKNNPMCPDFPHPVEYPIKTVKDIETYRYILDHTVLEPVFDDIEETLDAVGSDGTCEASGSLTPIQFAIEMLMGMETFYSFIMSDHVKETEELLEHLREINRQEYKLLAESPAPVIVTAENTSTTISSPDFMSKYEFPALNEFSDILHSNGKLHVAHMCGKLHNVVDLLEEIHCDGLMDVAPEPTGDFDFAADRDRLLSAGKSVAGGIDCTAFALMSTEQLEDYVMDCLSLVAPGRGFLLGSGDTVPAGTSAEKLMMVVSLLEKNGTYPLQQRPARVEDPP